MYIVNALQSLSFTQCTIIVPVVLAFLVFILPWIRKKLGFEVSGEMSDSANEGFGAKLFPLNYLPYLFEKNAVVVEFI